jgi:hypothetical protein
MNKKHPRLPVESDSPEIIRSRELLNGIRTDLQAVLDAESGLARAMDCLRAGMDDLFLDELQQVAKAYQDSERGRLFAMRNCAKRGALPGGRRA